MAPFVGTKNPDNKSQPLTLTENPEGPLKYHHPVNVTMFLWPVVYQINRVPP